MLAIAQVTGSELLQHSVVSLNVQRTVPHEAT